MWLTPHPLSFRSRLLPLWAQIPLCAGRYLLGVGIPVIRSIVGSDGIEEPEPGLCRMV